MANLFDVLLRNLLLCFARAFAEFFFYLFTGNCTEREVNLRMNKVVGPAGQIVDNEIIKASY